MNDDSELALYKPRDFWTDRDAEDIRPRPIRVWVLSILQVMLGFSSLYTFALIINGPPRVNMVDWVILTLSHGVIATVAGLGLWSGHRWAWWLATLHCVYLFVRDGCLLFSFAFRGVAHSPQQIFNSLLMIGGQLLIFACLLTPGTLDYFDLRQMKKLMTIAILAEISFEVLGFWANLIKLIW